jgi:phosphatidate phosphatase APP1
VLVGDSGEKDPEVYAEMMARHPQQVAAVYIRDITGEAIDAPRYQALLARPGVAASRWTVFTDPGTLPAVPAPPVK